MFSFTFKDFKENGNVNAFSKLSSSIMSYYKALFYSSAYDNDNAGFSEGNKRKLYETYSHSLVIILFSSLQHSAWENETQSLFLCCDYHHSHFNANTLFTICSLFSQNWFYI